MTADAENPEIATTVKDATAPHLTIPGYRIVRELGHGGMAHVYLAIQESFGREVALKVLSPHLADDEQFSKRFLREARIVSQLNHPNIITVYDAGKTGKYHYMSMEYIPGRDLKQLKDQLSRKQALHIIKDVARALDFAGSKGVVHRDIKPENIMIHQNDHRVVLMDFGIAHGDDVTQGMTQTGKAIGTPHFMSPEQTKGLKVDHRSEIYSLGIVLFQLLAGYLPYEADSAVAVGIKHLTAPIPLLPAGLEIFQPIVNRCLSKQPQHRYQKAADLIADLENITDAQLDSIDTRAVLFRQAGASPDAKTQISDAADAEALLNETTTGKRKVPELVFPTRHNSVIDDTPAPGNRRRNLLLLLLLVSIGWAISLKQQQIQHFWGYKALPKLAKQFPDLFPASYLEYWARKAAKRQPPRQAETATAKQPNAIPSQPETPPLSDPPAQAATAPPMSREEKILALQEGLDTHPENALELASIYKAMLQEKPSPLARQGLKGLRDWYFRQTQLAFANDDAAAARQYIDMMKQSFPRASRLPRFKRLERKVAFLERLEQHFQQAEKYFNAGALSKPQHQNALNEINKVLLLSPQNTRAKQFIDRIVQAYLDQTSELQQQGNIHNALLMVEEGIAALDNEPRLVNKRTELKERIQHNKTIRKLFKQAEHYQAINQLVRPRAYSAFDSYQAILELEKDNLQAQAALKTIHQQVAQRISQQIQQGELDKAKAYLHTAIQRYGKTPLLASVQLKLDDAYAAIAPQLPRLQLATQPFKTLVTVNKRQRLAGSKTLYIGFSYVNFEPGTTWLEALLLDNKHHRIAQQPVVISGQSGEHFFNIRLHNKPLRQGRYRLVIKLKNRVLVERDFTIE